MAQPTPIPSSGLAEKLIQESFLFQGLAPKFLAERLAPLQLKLETLFSNRPVYTAFLPEQNLDSLYVMLDEGLVITRTTPLDRIIALNYAGSCFGLRSLPFSYGLAARTFPCLVEAYKTAHVLKIPAPVIQEIYQESADFQERYRQLFELQQKFEYHLLNCGAYPPQAVASLLRGLIYQERELGRQPNAQGRYIFDLPIDVIARACQLNQRTVELVLKGMGQVKLIAPCKTAGDDALEILSPEGLKEVYGATREKVGWWPLR